MVHSLLVDLLDSSIGGLGLVARVHHLGTLHALLIQITSHISTNTTTIRKLQHEDALLAAGCQIRASTV